MGFTLSIQPSLFDKISNSGIGPVPAMVEADTTRPSHTGINRDFEPCFSLSLSLFVIICVKWRGKRASFLQFHFMGFCFFSLPLFFFGGLGGGGGEVCSKTPLFKPFWLGLCGEPNYSDLVQACS